MNWFLLIGFMKVGGFIALIFCTYYFKRWMLCLAFVLGAAAAATRGFTDAATESTVGAAVATTMGLLFVSLMLGSFVAAQTRTGGRPRQWTL